MATLKGNPRTKLSWDEGHRQLREFFNKNGHSNVNAKVPGLGKWVAIQRKKQDTIPPEHKLLLDELNFTWDSLQEIHQKKWMDMYDTLKAYFESYPGRMTERGYFCHDEKLHGWVCKVQISYKKGELSCDRIKLLEKLDFVWWQKSTQDLTDGSGSDVKRKMKNTWLACPPEKRQMVAKGKNQASFGHTKKGSPLLKNEVLETPDTVSMANQNFSVPPLPPTFSVDQEINVARQKPLLSTPASSVKQLGPLSGAFLSNRHPYSVYTQTLCDSSTSLAFTYPHNPINMAIPMLGPPFSSKKETSYSAMLAGPSPFLLNQQTPAEPTSFANNSQPSSTRSRNQATMSTSLAFLDLPLYNNANFPAIMLGTKNHAYAMPMPPVAPLSGAALWQSWEIMSAYHIDKSKN